jgi:putative tryptophan/tyrosine transport system substrate-binding protein
MMKRREFIAMLGGAAAAWSLAARAQPAKLPTIGYLGSGTPATQGQWIPPFVQRLRELGWIEGHNLAIEYRWAEGRTERFSEVAAEFVRLKVDVIVTYATHTKRVAILLNPDNPVSGPNLQAAERTAAPLGLELQKFEARGRNEVESAFLAMASRPVDAVAIFEDAIFFANTKSIAQNALAQRLPSIGYLDLTDAGGLMAYGVNFPETFRRAAVFVDKILKGTKPSELPVEQPTRFKLVLNLKSAKALHLEFPPTLLARADEVIE